MGESSERKHIYLVFKSFTSQPDVAFTTKAAAQAYVASLSSKLASILEVELKD